MTKELLAYHVHTSAYYPQGNAINEAAHKALERSLCASLWSGGDSFDDALYTAVSVHNSCPHSATGVSPFYALFGFEPTLPGWQKYRDQHDGALQKHRQHEVRQDAVIEAQLRNEDAKLIPKKQFQVGDWVIFFVTPMERKAHIPSEQSIKYTPSWLLPSKIVEVGAGVVKVEEWGKPLIYRQVPKAHVRKPEGTVPASLEKLTLKMLEFETPKALRPRVIDGGIIQQKPEKSWDELMRDIEKDPSRKRQRV